MNEREKILLELILSQNPITLQDSAILFGVSERTIRNSLDEIDAFLVTHDLPALVKQTTTSINFSSDPEIVRQLLSSEEQEFDENRWLEPSFRERLIYYEIALEENRITVEQLEGMLQTSRSTIHNDIRKLKRLLKESGISLEFSKKKGFYLSGNEYNIRRDYMRGIDYFHTIQFQTKRVGEETKDILKYFIQNLEQLLKKELAYESFFSFQEYLYLSIQRIKKGHEINSTTHASINQHNEIEAVKKHLAIIEKYFDITVSDIEIANLITHFESSNFVKDTLVDKGFKVDLNIIAEEFITKISEAVKVNLSKDDIFLKYLTMHFQSTLLKGRQKDSSLIISKEIITRIKNEYETVFQSVKEVVKQIPALMDLHFDTEENVGLLTLHVVTGLEQSRKNFEKEMTVLLICHLGIGTSQFLKARINSYFNFKTVIGSKKELDSLNKEQFELILSTIDLPDLAGKYLRVSPYLTEMNIEQINLNIEEIMKRKLEKEFERQKEGVRAPMLKDLLDENMIQTEVEAKNWEEGIKKAGELLIKCGAVSPVYVDKMIEAVHEFGPYIVVVPGIALAHASSKDGVNRIALSLVTLKNGDVKFGNKENDPVHTIIAMATIDHNTHLKAITELVSLLNMNDFREALLQSDKEKILSLIASNESNSKESIK